MKILLYALVLLFALGCENRNTAPKVSSVTDSTQKAKEYFPVLDYIKSEIRYVDSLPVGIMKYTTENGITDSAYIKTEEFHELSREFLPDALTKKTFENEFLENSFFDNTTQYSSFLYTSINENIQLRRVDVLVKAENVIYNKVNSIYLEKWIEKTDTSVMQKLLWKAGRNFQINTEIHTGNNKVSSKQVKVVWNSWE